MSVPSVIGIRNVVVAALMVSHVHALLDEDHGAAHHGGHQRSDGNEPEVCRGTQPTEGGQAGRDHHHPQTLTIEKKL